MKRAGISSHLFLKLGLIAGTTWLAAALSSQAGSHAAQWQKVDEAMNKGLPKSAIEALEPIIQETMQEKAYGEAAKAIARKIALEGNIQGNKPEEKITRMAAEIAKAPPEMTPILDTILAHWYWQYFQNNRWRFMQRTATAEAPGKDFTTWDLPRLFAEIDKQFEKALAAGDTIKTIPIASFDELLEKGELPDSYRPTLYDFIAHEALAFYTSGEQAAAKPQDAFEISADSEIFDPVAKFMNWRPETTDTDAPAVKALRLYQDLLRFHQKEADPTAFRDVDLARLVWGENVAVGEGKAARFKAALALLADQWTGHELSAMVLYHWARLLQEEGNLLEAHRLAERSEKAFPKSPGGKQCHNLIQEIETESVSITTEHVWNAPLPKIAVSYRNVGEVYFRAVAYDWDLFLDRNHSRPQNLNPKERAELLSRKPALEWSAKLPPTTDFQARTEELPARAELKPGFYLIVASPDRDFNELKGQITFADVWVSDLALVIRTHNGVLDGFVLEAASGEPVGGAEVQAWSLNNRGERVAAPAQTTDDNGFFQLAAGSDRNYLVRARHKGRELASRNDHYVYSYGLQSGSDQTVFFADRALYRPGQTIQYKGISVHVDLDGNNYQPLAGRALTVVFSDSNGKEIARQEQRCNDYGSFSGSFTAPRDRLMGMMQIQVQAGPPGSVWFNVEEYKRPKFQVTLDAPKIAPKLNDKVSLIGHAMGYTGAAIDDAPVKYRVVRDVRWPMWWGWCCLSRAARDWRMPSYQSGSQEISHGVVRTGKDGAFTIEFAARPDLAISETNEPTFVFQVYADVTDNAGETRSANRTVNVGYTALQAAMSADEWQVADKPVELKITTTTLDGQPQSAKGSLKIYRLQPPAQVQRPNIAQTSPYYYRRGGPMDAAGDQEPDLSNPNAWPLGEVVESTGFKTADTNETKVAFKLKAGLYRAMLETKDRFGKKVTALLPLQVLAPHETKLALKIPHLLAAPAWTIEPGKEFLALWGTGYEQGRAFVEIEHRHKMIQRYWTKPGETQAAIRQAITEAMRGGFTLYVTQVRENRAYLDSRRIDVPWNNKNLKLEWEHMTSKLQPGQKETWTAVVTGPDAQKTVAEMVATLYDASLDAYRMHDWQRAFGFFYQDQSYVQSEFVNSAAFFQYLQGSWPARPYEGVGPLYRRFPPDLAANFLGYGDNGWGSGGKSKRAMLRASPFGGEEAMDAVSERSVAKPMAMNAIAAAPAAAGSRVDKLGRAEAQSFGLQKKDAGGGEPDGGAPDLNKVAARKNLNETAFFFPQLISDTNGVVRMTFTMPEALTEWRFLGFAHDKQLRAGFLEGKTVTAKDLMVQPNPPRFLREGDVLEFTVKVSNQTDTRQKGKVRLTLNEAMNDQSADQRLGNDNPEQSFDIPARESRSYSWKLTVPDGMGFLTYKAVGSAGAVSDGEEGYLPVLSRRILVIESLPLPIRGPATKKFEFKKLLESGKSDTLRNQSLTVQMVSQPAWYAVMALPYLMEYPYECSEQTFNRLYANALARHIAQSDPKIHRIFEQWRNTPALDSPLEKNQDLKSVALEETPWYRQAQAESQARRNVGILFDDNRLNDEIGRAMQKLADMQSPNGGWVWFPGGYVNEYITLYITTGFGRLRHLGVKELDMAPAIRSLTRLDGWIDEMYREIVSRGHKDGNNLSDTIALYLYGRSFFLADQPIPASAKEAVDYFLGQGKTNWLALANRQSQGHLAIALLRFGDKTTPVDIMKSIKEHSVSDEELGMFWRDTELSWWWYRAPIETQALMIEAFDEVMHDAQAVEDCQVWLLKQKQTQDWKTTKATADAVYALLLRGSDKLSSDALVEMTVGGQEIKPEKVEAGTGFYEHKFAVSEIQPKMGEITLKKVDAGVAWGSMHWQYMEDMTKVTPYEGTPLKLKKAVFIKTTTKKGPVLEAVKGPLKVGDELVVRVELRTDRDMEYVHLKDQRGSGLEPVNVISQYKYQDGLGYYESTRDTASHFFIDYLPKGVYVFEYSTRVVHRGDYQTGIAEIQCMYAPEFNSHSESFRLDVK